MKIVIIQTENDTREVLIEGLELYGFSVLASPHGLGGLELCYRHKPEIILMALHHSLTNGWDVLRQLNCDVELNQIPIIVFSANADPKLQSRALSMGASDYMVMPLHIDVVAARAKVLIERYRFNKEKLEDLKAAALLQRKFLTSSQKIRENFRHSNFSLETYNRPMGDISGDFFFPKGLRNHYGAGFFFADTCGHGLSAGLLSMRVLSRVETLESPIYHPSELLYDINSDLFGVIPAGRFIAASYSICLEDKLIFANAGQPPPILITHGFAELLPHYGNPLAIAPNVTFNDVTIKLHTDDKLLMYTDGLIEATNAEGEEYGYERFLMVCANHSNLPLRQLIEAIIADLTAFSGTENFDDDISLAIFQAKTQKEAA